MMRQRLTYANVMSTIAVFVVLGGTGYAATRLARNSVGSPQIRNGAIKNVDISSATKRSLRGKRGAKGPTGASGPAGTAGPSEMIEVKRTAEIPLSGPKNVNTTLATVQLTAGSWLLEAQTQLHYDAADGDNYFCELVTDQNGFLNRGTASIGTGTPETQYATLSARSTIVLTTPTAILYRCSHANVDEASGAKAENTVVTATRTGGVTNQ
ncbi:MAG: hypothetical protein QOG46_2205 [Pseudonocardiales bacterium]|nr:hypothetical protein [Pseudonocardiales bacterium]